MRFFPLLALVVTLAMNATASDLLLYLDFEQTPPQDPHYLASDPSFTFTFEPLELNALERSLKVGDGQADGDGFTFDPLELNALARSLQGTAVVLDPRIASLPAPMAAFTGHALDRSGAGRDTIAKGNVVLLSDTRSTAAYFASKGRLQLFESAWWDDSAPKRAMSVLAWVNVYQVTMFRLQDEGAPQGDDDLAALPVPEVLQATFEPPVSLFPYVTPDGGLHWSLHAESQEPIFTLDAPLTVGEWFHIAGTYDSAEGVAKLYLNGEEVATGRGDMELGVYASATGVIALGRSDLLSSWSMDDLNIWRGALSGDEVRAVMEFGPVVDNATAVDDGDAVTTWGMLKAR